MGLRIENKAAIVTGGSTGVGKEIAQELALNCARVIITARNKDRLESAANSIREYTGADVIAVPLDVSDAKSPARLAKEALTQFGGVDILVNNAGRAHPGKLMDTNDDDWDDMIGTKINALVRVCREAISHMRAGGWSRIVNFSLIGEIYSNPNLLISHTLSVAINNFTKGLALEVAADGILVNAIANAQKWHKGKAFLSTLADLCERIGVETIAEWIKNDTNFNFMKECGIDYVQDFLFGKPALDADDFSQLPSSHLFTGKGSPAPRWR